jgi:NAD(P)-dependent dehydrogenase (short-subunit alcohol dehydrogenase family)
MSSNSTRTAIVTGSSRGIGAAVAEHLNGQVLRANGGII